MFVHRVPTAGLARIPVLVLLATPIASTAASPASTAAPPGFADETVISDLTNPTVVRFSPDGRVFVAEKSGLIKVFDGLSDTSPDTFADLRTQVHNFWDRGLLGLALHPLFPTDPRVYVLYTHDAPPGESAPYWGEAGSTSDPCPNPPGATRDGCVVTGRLSVLWPDGSEQVLIEDWCQQYPSHSIGTVEFGPDGMLYASAGDGASFTFVDYGQDGDPVNPCDDPPGGVGGPMTLPSAQGGALRSQDLLTMSDPLTLDGSIIRVDPDTGAGLPDNPLAGTPGDPNAHRLIAHGLRNAFRFAFRPGTDELWSGDVGWNTYEEINRIADVNDATVENFGWPCYEGPSAQSGYSELTLCQELYAGGGQSAPYYAYNHNDSIVSENPCPTGGSSQAGIAFYRGGSYPAEYDGALFAADYSRDCIWVMRSGADGVPSPDNRQRFVTDALDPVHLEIGPEGDLFYVNFSGGTIQRVTYTAGNQSPVAVASATPTEGTAPLDVSFDATASADPDGDPLTHAWDLDGDGAFDDASGATATWTYTQSGTVVASVQVTDSGGASDTDSVTITVNNTGPTASIDTPGEGLTWAVGDLIDFSGSAADTEDGTLPASALDWSLVLHHCDTPTTCHEHPIQDFEGTSSGVIDAPDHDYPSFLELRLTATDSGGLTDTATLELQPRTVDLSIASVPGGLQVAFNGEADLAPFTKTVIVGSTITLTAPTPQALGGTSYAFSAWSDGGDVSHNIVAPATAPPYTATFEEFGGLAPPDSLRAAVYSRTAAELFWDRPETADLLYEIRRDGVVLTTTDGVSFFDDTLAGATAYTYAVIAIDRAGRRSAPASVSLTTRGGATAGPPAPTGLRAAVYSRTAAELFWERSETADLGYEVRRGGGVATLTDGVSFFDDALTPASTYVYEVIAIDRDGNRSEPARVELRTRGGDPGPIAPQAPSGLRAAVYSSTAAELFWDRAASFGLRYELIRDGAPIGSIEGTSYFDDTLAPRSLYHYEVIAVDRDGARSAPAAILVHTNDG